MSKDTKTNALRLLDQAGIAYETLTYEVDESNLAATHTAEQVGVNPKQLFKTLVLRGDRCGLFVCVIPGDGEVDLKKAAKAAGDKKADLIPMKELLPTVGYMRGACSPIGMKKPLPTFFDSTAMNWPYIYLSAGRRGLQMRVDAQKIISYTHAVITDLTKQT